MRVGIVLAGGGAKGAYQVGVLKALEEFRIMPFVTDISGTSVGALNALAYTQGYRRAQKTWDMVNEETILQIPGRDFAANIQEKLMNWKIPRRFYMVGKVLKDLARGRLINLIIKSMLGIFSREGLEKIIQSFDLERIANEIPELYATVLPVKFPLKTETISLRDHNSRDFTDLLLASSAIPFAFPTQNYRDNPYWDGGFFEIINVRGNFPVEVLKEKCDFIIGIDMEADPKKRKKNEKKVDIYIASDTYFFEGILSKTMNFSKELYGKMHDLGYHDAGRSLLKKLREIREAEFRKKMKKKEINIYNAFSTISKKIDTGSIANELNSIAESLDINVDLYDREKLFGSKKKIEL